MKIGILGAGLSGLALAFFLQQKSKISRIDLFEKEPVGGGLCRSFNFRGIDHDIGPHVIFSRDREIFDLMTDLLGNKISRFRRSNKIYYKGRFIKYPFENELSALPEEDRNYCLRAFLNNPYRDRVPENLLEFFLKTFGRGMTELYLKPYNEKIWKRDLAELAVEIAGRIPQPPPEDIIKSASGISTEGYLHQLHFYYPKEGGISMLPGAFRAKLHSMVGIITAVDILDLRSVNGRWELKTSRGHYGGYDLIVSTIPVQALTGFYRPAVPDEILQTVKALQYNSIIIALFKVKQDRLGNHFAVMIPDRNVIFHRISKLNFLGEAYGSADGSTNLMIEITYAQNSIIAKMSDENIYNKIIGGLEDLEFIEDRRDVRFADIQRFKYAYVVCDLEHRAHITSIKNFYDARGLKLCGRFGEFEYWNMDTVIRRAKELSDSIG
jgi:protoporphyrinogen oxidase